MRQRNVKNKEEILRRCTRWIVWDPAAEKGSWAARFSRPGRIFLEIGSGKGQFITSLSLAHPERNYVAVEGGENILVRMAEKAEAAALDNLLIIAAYVDDPCDWFAKGEISGIYLNFCDPWPKSRHAKRRLTHRSRLDRYCRITDREAELVLKTDNRPLFDFSLKEFEAAGLHVLDHTVNLYGSNRICSDPVTEYEDQFAKEGKPICYARVALHGHDMEENGKGNDGRRGNP
ncbi:MAG: tRNA (guanosine(46)-N7)-methyltransferase TrmB [Eubacteriales bacterium]|nr:tRNA (guanosine(46)-N7)-methyltransferase TrmB [Eubacteriales bacterium]MDD4285626.1 tRNA (guanosine(46)-N7)-methyltransferase TrmB [Eubacteriales bacterium]HPF18166.1 tRNA (guanosine(46)-N7)-methyltransferase TrmB [Bacillota bacterium]